MDMDEELSSWQGCWLLAREEGRAAAHFCLCDLSSMLLLLCVVVVVVRLSQSEMGWVSPSPEVGCRVRASPLGILIGGGVECDVRCGLSTKKVKCRPLSCLVSCVSLRIFGCPWEGAIVDFTLIFPDMSNCGLVMSGKFALSFTR